jgi:glutaredoxin
MAHQVVLYTRERCSLCEKAKAVILAVRREVEFEFREVDIGWSGDLYEDYKHDIPVIEVDGKRAFKYRVQASELKERLSR